jgi:hypothetical protein
MVQSQAGFYVNASLSTKLVEEGRGGDEEEEEMRRRGLRRRRRRRIGGEL